MGLELKPKLSTHSLPTFWFQFQLKLQPTRFIELKAQLMRFLFPPWRNIEPSPNYLFISKAVLKQHLATESSIILNMIRTVY